VTDAFPDGADLARGALEWLLTVAREDGTALAWTGRPDDDEFNPTLYSGTAGIVLAFLEGYRHFGDDRFAVAAVRGARAIAVAVDREWELSSLYFGLAGMAFTLRAAAGMLGERAADLAAARALHQVRSRFDGERWADQFELLGGNAGIVRELLRYARIHDRQDAGYAITWPDHPPATPHQSATANRPEPSCALDARRT
jgi:hypothetical protein